MVLRLPLTLLSVVIACIGCESSSVRRPWMANAEASAAIQEFNAASVVESTSAQDPAARQWSAPLTLGDPPIKVKILGRAHMSVINVECAHKGEVRAAHEAADYTNIIEIRVKGSKLFIHRTITLFWTEHRLALFDLAECKPVADYLVSPDDLPVAR